MNFRCLIFECVDTLMPGIFLPQQSTCNQKKRKMKKPCSELNMAKRNWKAVEASRTVRAPKTHIISNRAITPMRLIMSLTTVCRFAAKPLLTVLDEYGCYYHKYSSIEELMAKMGPQKAPKIGVPRKNPRTNKLDSSMLKSKNQATLFVNYSYNSFYDFRSSENI